jgi:Tol biopolymer transport system component
MNADGTDSTRLTEDPEPEYDPTRSPVGTKIAFTSAVGPDAEMYVMGADETNPMNLTDDEGLNEYDPAWSPGGGKIIFAGHRSGDQVIIAINIDGTG